MPVSQAIIKRVLTNAIILKCKGAGVCIIVVSTRLSCAENPLAMLWAGAMSSKKMPLIQGQNVLAKEGEGAKTMPVSLTYIN